MKKATKEKRDVLARRALEISEQHPTKFEGVCARHPAVDCEAGYHARPPRRPEGMVRRDLIAFVGNRRRDYLPCGITIGAGAGLSAM